jgi:hypothetical protein
MTESTKTPQTIGRRGRPIRVFRADLLATDAEWQAIVARAQEWGKPPGRFVRETVLQALRKTRPNSAEARVVRELGRAGTALAHLAATARETGALPAAAMLETALADLVAVTRRLQLARPARQPAP